MPIRAHASIVIAQFQESSACGCHAIAGFQVRKVRATIARFRSRGHTVLDTLELAALPALVPEQV